MATKTKVNRKVPCIFCGEVFSSSAVLNHHRAKTNELNIIKNRRLVLEYRKKYTRWQTLNYFRISQETLKAIKRGLLTSRH